MARPRKPLLRRELEADDSLEQAVDGRAAQHPALGVEQEAVHRLRAQQLGDLVHEPLQHRLQLELAGHDLSGLEERALLAEPPLVLLEESRRVQREPDLARDCLRQRDLAGRPGPRIRPVETQHADHSIEHDDRRGQHRAGAELDQRLDVPERLVQELGRVEHVRDRDGAALARGEVRDRQPARIVADRGKPLCPPLGADRQRLVRLADPDETAGSANCATGLGHRHPRDRVEVVHRANAA